MSDIHEGEAAAAAGARPPTKDGAENGTVAGARPPMKDIPGWFFPVATGLVVLVVLGIGIITASTLLSPIDSTSDIAAENALLNKVMAIRSLQILVGYTLGFFCILCGMILCWTGILGATEVSAKASEANITIRSAQVGVVVIVCGVVLVGLSLVRPQARVVPQGSGSKPEAMNPAGVEGKTGGRAFLF